MESFPCNHRDAAERLLVLVRAAENRKLRLVSIEDFKRGWYSIGFLYAGLHPDSALEHGRKTSYVVEDNAEIRQIEPRLLAPYYVQSGWPVILAPVAREAWRRYEAGELTDEQFYCSDAVVAGIRHRTSGGELAVQAESRKLNA